MSTRRRVELVPSLETSGSKPLYLVQSQRFSPVTASVMSRSRRVFFRKSNV